MYEWKIQELTERINRLEAGLAATRSELPPIKARLDDLGKAFQIEGNSTSQHFNFVYEYIRGIHIQLWPLVHKMFPGSAKTQRQITSILKSDRKSSD